MEGPESFEDVTERVRPFVESLLKTEREHVLLVGHGASVHGLIKNLRPEHEPTSTPTAIFNWNCSLTTFRVAEGQVPELLQLFQVSHIPAEAVSSNLTFRAGTERQENLRPLA
jgi:broad specificity phosphatase PhoE